MRLLSLYYKHYQGFSLPIWLSVMATFVNATGVMLGFFAAIYLVDVEHFSVMQMSWVFAASGVGGIVGAYVGGVLADRFNHVRICQISLMCVALQNILISVVHDYWFIMALFCLSNFFTFTFRPSNTLILFAHCEKSDRTRVFALYRTANNLGLACSVVIGGILAKINFEYFFWFTALMGLISSGLLLVWFKQLSSKRMARENQSSKSPWFLFFSNRAFLILWVLCLCNYLIFYQIRSTYGLYFTNHDHLSVSMAGYIFGINMVLIVLLEVPLMSCLKMIEPRYLVMLGTILMGAGFAILPLSSLVVIPILSMILITLGEIFVSSPYYVLAMRYADKNYPGFFMGIFQGALTMGLVLAPLLGGFLYPYWDARVLWYGCGVLSLLMLIGFCSLRRSDAV